MSVSSVEALELGQILGALLASIVDAQAHSARATVEFVEDIGFETTVTGEKLRVVTMRYKKKDENGQAAEFEVDVPLLAMVNVPSLAVKTAQLTFSYDVVTAVTTEPPPAQPNAPPPLGVVRVPIAAITGFVRRPPATSKETERRTTAIDLSVTLEQQEMPVGIERLFDLAELGLIERKMGEQP
jgi:hypothetical protein